MAEQWRQHTDPKTKQRVIDLLKMGTTVTQITARMHVDKSFVKRCQAEIKSQLAQKTQEQEGN